MKIAPFQRSAGPMPLYREAISEALTSRPSGSRSLALEIIKRSDQAKGFQLLPGRWVVERTFGWLMKSRRLVRDHERKPSHHEAFVYLAMIGFATRRLTH